MRNIFTALLFFISISLFSQDEKRLALVIGNANYNKGELKNPVNDARLIASTLDSLNFDVILKENLATKRDMTGAIREFGSKRSEYDVAFVYYAGHGIQVDNENFLLPTKEVFEEEFDVMDYGVSVQNIMRYLRAESNEVNILILDACRDNPFESNWSATRSLKGGGLAKIPPPTGSLIAFSTDSGQTAPDGDGQNSVYTTSLSKNMLLEDTSIDQVFRNIRAEVLAKTEGNQRPVEATQLTGQTFYLKPGTYENEINEIDKILFSFENIENALELCNIILSQDPNYYNALQRKAHALTMLEKYEEADSIYKDLYNIKPSDNINISGFIIHDNYQYTDIGFLGNYCDENCSGEDDIQNFIDIYNMGLTNDLENPWILINFMDQTTRVNNDLEVTFLENKTAPLYENESNQFPEKYINFLKEYDEEEILRGFKDVAITNKKFNVNEYLKSIVTGFELSNSYNVDDWNESKKLIEKHYETIDPEFEKFYSSYINYYVGPVYRYSKNIERGNEILIKTIKNSDNLYTQLDSRIELYYNLIDQGKFDDGINFLKEANEMISNVDIQRETLERFLSVILLNLSNHLMIIENDTFSALKIYEKITDDTEIRKYILDEYIAYAYYNQYLCNILNKRYNEAEKNLNDFFIELKKNEADFYLSGKYVLKKNGEYFDWSVDEGEYSSGTDDSFNIISQDLITIELFNVEEYGGYYERKNRVFEVLSNSNINYTINQISENLDIPKKLIKHLWYTLSSNSTFDSVNRKISE